MDVPKALEPDSVILVPDFVLAKVPELPNGKVPKTVAGLVACVDITRPLQDTARTRCAERLLKIAPKKGAEALWKVVRQPQPKEDPLGYLSGKGILLGALAVYYAAHHQPSMLAQIERTARGNGIPAADHTRMLMINYIVDHPHPDLEQYVLEGFGSKHTQFDTSVALKKWPYSEDLARAAVKVFEKPDPESSADMQAFYRGHLAQALCRWKKQSPKLKAFCSSDQPG